MQFLIKNNFSRGFELKAGYSLIFYVSHTSSSILPLTLSLLSPPTPNQTKHTHTKQLLSLLTQNPFGAPFHM